MGLQEQLLQERSEIGEKQHRNTNSEEIEQLAKNDLKVLAEMLGEKEFFFGNAASLLDLVVFSHLAQLTVVEESVACPLRDHIKAEHGNLISLVDRMKALTWGEDWAIATEKLDRNPHIPKPIEEQVKIIVDDVVEKATEEKVEEGEEKKDEEKKDEEEKKDDEKKEGEEAIEEASEVDVSTTTAEKKTLMQKLMTIKRDLMAN